MRRGDAPSRIAYNVYSDGHWYLHISTPGTTLDAAIIRGLVVWDIRDLDGDGQDEWIITPTELEDEPDVPGYYFAKWETRLYRWDESTMALGHVGTYPGVLPEMIPAFRTPSKTTSYGDLYPVLTVLDDQIEPRLVLRQPDGSILLQSLESGAR